MTYLHLENQMCQNTLWKYKHQVKMLFFALLQANGFHFDILAGINHTSVSGKKSENNKTSNWGFSLMPIKIGYRWIMPTASNMLLDWNFLNMDGSFVNQKNKTQFSGSVSLTNFHVGKIFKEKFAVYAILNPLNVITSIKANDRDMEELGGGLAFTFGLGGSYKLFTALSLCAQYSFDITYFGFGTKDSDLSALRNNSPSLQSTVASTTRSIRSHKILAGIQLHTSKFYNAPSN